MLTWLLFWSFDFDIKQVFFGKALSLYQSRLLMPVNLAQYRGTVGTFNNRNIASKIIYSLLTCRVFRKLNQNIIFLVITLLRSITLILSLSSTLLNSFHSKIKTIHCCSENFLNSYRHNAYSIYMGACFSN